MPESTRRLFGSGKTRTDNNIYQFWFVAKTEKEITVPIPYRETLKRYADHMTQTALEKGKATGHPPYPISYMELRCDIHSNGINWALRVGRPTQIPRSRWVDAFGMPSDTPECEEKHAVYWFWCEGSTESAAWTVMSPPLIQD